MSEEVELRTFNINNGNESDTEYHEIRNEGLLESPFSPEPPTLPKAFDFFTQFNVRYSSQKGGRKRKKSKKNDSTNLMDIIASELASTQPLVRNAIIKVDHFKKQESYLRTPRYQSLYTSRKVRRGDVELGRSQRAGLVPVFPRVLENAIAKVNAIQVEYMEPALFNDIITEYQEHDVKQSTKFLDITIKDINFSHHHDFSIEKLLCVKLIDCYKEYSRIQNDIKETLKNIDIYKNTRDNLKKELFNITSNKNEDIRFDQTVLKYTGKFLRLKDKYYELLENENTWLQKVLSLWEDIEMIRMKTEIADTELVVEVTKNTLNDEDFEKEFTHTFETEYCDMLDQLEYEYANKYLEYKNLKQNLEAGDRKKYSKPKLNFDQDKVKERVEEIVSRIVVKEKVNVTLKENKYVLKYLNKEQASSFNYNFKIYVDNVFVCESEIFTYVQNLNTVEFFDTLTIEILPNNSTLEVYLCEDDIKVASISFNLPDIHIDSCNARFRKEKFIYTYFVSPTARKIGSGYEFKDISAINNLKLKTSNMFQGKLCTLADVYLKLGWSDRFVTNQCEAIKDSMLIGKQLKRFLHGIDKPNISILSDVIEKLYNRSIDRDSNFINALQEACKGSIHTDCTISIDEKHSDFVRLKLLHLRNHGGFDDVVNKTVPIFASQISTEQLNCLQKSEEKEIDLQHLESNADVDPIDVQRFISVQYMQKMNSKVQKNLNNSLLKKTYKDVVRDFKDLSLRGIFSNNSNLELDSTSSITKQRLLKECLTKEQEINVTVLKAFNLLDRSTGIISEEAEDESIAGFKVRPLRPFVRFTYHGISTQSGTAIGCHPTWNYSTKIKAKLAPLSSIHVDIYDECKVDISEAYSEEELSSLGRVVHYRFYNKWLGTVQIPLFTVLSLGSLRGTFKITTPPLLFGYDTPETKDSKSIISEVTQLMKKDTSFVSLKITTNLFHLGSFQGYTQPMPSSEDDLVINHINVFVTDYLNEYPTRNISLTFIDSSGRNKCVTEFLQPTPLPDTEWFPKNPKRTESAMSGLSRSSSSKSSRRKLSIATIGEDKEFSVNVPESRWKGTDSRVDQVSRLVDAAVRYVALIPTYELTESHVVTLRATELLKVIYGSPQDHTILMACYFLHLGIECWVVVGMGLPRGLTSYVLIRCDHRNRPVMLNNIQKSRGVFGRNDSKRYSWVVLDAVSGERFELRDIGCPLKTVSYVFDAENIWVNIQNSQECESMSFDFSKSSDWQPVFDGPLMMRKQPPVCDNALYSAPPDVERLRETLESKLRSKVQKWRPHLKTVWNRYCSSLLRDMLPQLEYWAFNPTEPRPTPGQRLKQLMVTYKMFGFPLNVPYVNAKSVSGSVRSTGVHLNDDPDAEFALAVQVYGYPNGVLSVWVFLASITKI